MTNVVAIVESEVSPLVREAQSIIITSPKDMSAAVSFLSKLNVQLDRITTEKEKVTKPLNEALKAERGRWKPLETVLESAIASVRTVITRYQTEESKRAAESAAKIAARVGEGKGHLKAETAIKKLSEIDKPEERVATDEGTVKFREVQKFAVEDMSKLPIEYHLADEVKIRAVMREGKELSGVRYWTEQSPINMR